MYLFLICLLFVTSYNIFVIQSCYELDAFHGLCKFHPDDNLEPKLASIKDENSENFNEQIKSDISDEETNSVQIEGSFILLMFKLFLSFI